MLNPFHGAKKTECKENVLRVKQTEGDGKLFQFRCCSVAGLGDCAKPKVTEMQRETSNQGNGLMDGLVYLPEGKKTKKKEW